MVVKRNHSTLGRFQLKTYSFWVIEGSSKSINCGSSEEMIVYSETFIFALLGYFLMGFVLIDFNEDY